MLFDDNPAASRLRRRGTVTRIAIVSEHASPLAAPGSSDCGSQSTYVANLARELGMAGCLVDIFTRRASAARAPLVHLGNNVRLIHVPAGPAHYVPKEQLLPFMDAFASYVARFARRQAAMYQVVHANFFMSGVVAQHLRRTLGIPFVISFHGLGKLHRLAQGTADACPPARLRIEENLMADAERIIAACPQERHDLQQLYGAQPGRIDVAPAGFDPHQLWPVPSRLARHKLGLLQGKFIVLQLGRLVPRKGIDNAIDSLALLRRQHRVDATLLVVGGDTGPGAKPDPSEQARLRSHAHQHGVAEHVQFAGPKQRAQLRYYYSAANAVVSTPWQAPLGTTVVEAMACARPVIGAAVGAIGNTVADGATGFLVPARDPAAVAGHLALLHAEPGLARALGDEGMRRAYQHHTWSAVARQAAAAYEQAVFQAAQTVFSHTRSTHVPAEAS